MNSSQFLVKPFKTYDSAQVKNTFAQIMITALSKAIKWINTLVGNRIYLRCFTSLIRSWTFIIHRRRFSHVKMDSIFSINFREFKKVAEVVKIWAAGLILLLLSTPAEAVNSSVNMRFFPAGEEKISQRKSVWLLAFGKEAKPFWKSSCNSRVSSTSQMSCLPILLLRITAWCDNRHLHLQICILPGYVHKF